MTPHRMQMIRFACLALLAASIAACGVLPKKQPLALYAPRRASASTRAGRRCPGNCRCHARTPTSWSIRRASWCGRCPGELQVYKGAVWAQPAPDLLQDTLLRAFEDSGRIPGVARRGSGIAGDYELLLDLRRFESDYAGGGNPSAVVEVGAKLVAARNNSVIASRTFRQAGASASTDIAAVAHAFDRSLGAITGEIVGWTLVEGQRHAAQNPVPAR